MEICKLNIGAHMHQNVSIDISDVKSRDVATAAQPILRSTAIVSVEFFF